MSDLKKGKGFLSLTFRYVLHLAGVGAFLSILIIGYASFQQKRIVLREMEQRAHLLCESLAGASSLRYFLGDLTAIRYIFASAKEIEDVTSITLTDPKGAVEIHSGLSDEALNVSEIIGTEKTKVWRDQNHIHAVAPLTVRRQKSQVTDMLLEPAPVNEVSESDTLGYIQVNMSLKRTNAYLRDLILRSIAATLMIIALGSGLAFFFFRKTVLNPILRLARAMTEARSGHLEVRLDVVQRDEVGILTQSFNEMTADLKKAEEELMRANLDLENRVKKRTRDLEQALQELKQTQEKMLRSQKLAAIGQLASSVGHELRNPLGAINNAIYYIRDALKGSAVLLQDPSLSEFLNMAETEIQNSTRIIKDLLDFAHVGRHSLQPTDLNGQLKSLKNVVTIPKNIQIIEDYSPEMPSLLLDSQRMRQVFINLIVNAVQAMPEGGRLFVSTRFQNGPGPENPVISVIFQDTGTGMSEETMKKLFEPLFTTKSKGTGLGLAICRGIVDSHGGKIFVESVLGKGSTFTVRLSGPQLRTAEKS